MSLKIQKEREPSMAQLEQRETTIGFVDPQQSSPPNYDDATKGLLSLLLFFKGILWVPKFSKNVRRGNLPIDL